MKQLLMFVLTGFCLNASGQTVDPEVMEKLRDSYQKQKNSILGPYRLAPGQNFSQGFVNVTPKLAPGVHFLPQDGMPCLVPDVSGIAAIPNAWSVTTVQGKKAERPMGAIPNPSVPLGPSKRR
ncbi:MAG TPA: hypothetical protein VFR58_13885 [Flavisolibacter sp.]|nr:hypothetical protein [Flavisolibacter sp.]